MLTQSSYPKVKSLIPNAGLGANLGGSGMGNGLGTSLGLNSGTHLTRNSSSKNNTNISNGDAKFKRKISSTKKN